MLDMISSKITNDLSTQTNKRQLIHEYEEQNARLKKSIVQLSAKVKLYAHEEKQHMNEIAYLDSQISHIVSKQVNHYHELLQLGLDYRQDGLPWIIKSIWLLGESVNLNRFPKWLDNEAIEYILDVRSTINLNKSLVFSQLNLNEQEIRIDQEAPGREQKKQIKRVE